MKKQNHSNPPKSFIKWAGGKRQLLPEILPRVPAFSGSYYEPFLGGGALLFALQPKRAVLNDLNSQLIDLYLTVKYEAETLIERLEELQSMHMQDEDKAGFYKSIANQDRAVGGVWKLGTIDRAARFIYLNKTGFNGLYRVNKAGFYNVPYGKRDKPQICDYAAIRAACEYLRNNQTQFKNESFFTACADAGAGDFVYLDPPYDPVSKTANFATYQAGGFSKDDQRMVLELCEDLTRRGAAWMVSNNDTPFIRDLFSGYNIEIVKARRNINCNGSGRGAVDEVLIRNY